MNSVFFYNEVYKNILAVPKEDRHVLDMRLSEAVSQVTELSYIARNKGLLALEEACMSIPDEGISKHFGKMMAYIVDGTEPSIIEEIFTLRYFSNGFAAADALEYLLYLNGVLSMQAGDNPRIIEEKLMQFLSDEGEEAYRKNVIEKRDTF